MIRVYAFVGKRVGQKVERHGNVAKFKDNVPLCISRSIVDITLKFGDNHPIESRSAQTYHSMCVLIFFFKVLSLKL